MIAVRRWSIRGWGLETTWRVHVVRPSEPLQSTTQPSERVAERAAIDRMRRQRADRMWDEAAVRWITLGGR
jgi:hypothetical protein